MSAQDLFLGMKDLEVIKIRSQAIEGVGIMLTHKQFKARALRRSDVKDEYDRLEDEFAVLDEFLRMRTTAGLTQAEVAHRMDTTQSAIARLESGRGKNSPTLATLRSYARALGLQLEFRLAVAQNRSVNRTRAPRN
jgi:DNA-binding XRE family transcriptional regulator